MGIIRSYQEKNEKLKAENLELMKNNIGKKGESVASIADQSKNLVAKAISF